MGIARDLLALAARLAAPAPEEPEQVSLRRSVSTAYYALFQYLVQEAAKGWNGTFQYWARIRTHPAANEYLLSLLVGNNRD